jgi:hypothetical protein
MGAFFDESTIDFCAKDQTDSHKKTPRKRVFFVRPQKSYKLCLLIFGLHHLHINVDSRREREVRESLDHLWTRVEDVDHPLVGAHLKLFSRVLVDEGRTVDRVLLYLSRKWDRANHVGVKAHGGVDDLLHGSV